jgi:glycosyltransferase involved in cell wall biosynthesis
LFGKSTFSFTFAKKITLDRGRKIFVALPLMDELENIRALLLCFQRQSFRNFEVVVCVNQPDRWWDDSEKKPVCLRNEATIGLLRSSNAGYLTVIDRSTKGRGWSEKQFGVGWARKTIMDHISEKAEDQDVILTLDGDTIFLERYFETVVAAFLDFPDIKAIAIPYYHPLPVNDIAAARAMLRYEIYMRCFALNMLRIDNPYAFTALGSAIACTAKTYKSIGGITPHKSGEDFYFVQKIRKFGGILIWIDEKVYPAARFSDRVCFGTGPAMIKGNQGDWSAYPIFPTDYFDEIKTTFDGFKKLYNGDHTLPMTEFLTEKFGKNFWRPLRKNSTGADLFIKACRHKVDGLRILQYLKWRHQGTTLKDEINLETFLSRFYPDDDLVKRIDWEQFDFSSIETLNLIRDFLTEKEGQWRKKIRILR